MVINRPTVINNQTTNIVHNTTNVNNWFQSNSWKTRVTVNSNHWNGRPWWSRSDYGDWHHGHWHSHYLGGRDSWKHVNAQAHTWLTGLPAWGLGNLVYRNGYLVYSNPYRVRAIVIGTTTIDYSRPICVQLSVYEKAYASDADRAAQLRSKALTYFSSARANYYRRDYRSALANINAAVALMPDDTSLHEFRALVLFALNRYQESAEAIHAVLAVAPGWDWTTLSGFYGEHAVYQAQLRSLELFVRRNPKVPHARFLLAYHYITMGHPQDARTQLRNVLVLKPKDRLSADLLSLVTRRSQPDAVVETPLRIEGKNLRGDWKAKRPQGEIELELRDGAFVWDYDLPDNDRKFRGKFTLRNNVVVFATEDGSQMVGTVTLKNRNQFVFRLLGAGDDDPGLTFIRQ